MSEKTLEIPPEELEGIINQMIDSGEPEEDIAVLINHYNKLDSNSKVKHETEIEPPEKELYITSDFISRDEEEITAYEEQELDKIKPVNSGQNIAFIGSGSSSITPTLKPRKRYIESEIIDLASKAQEIQDPNNLTDEEIERIKKNINIIHVCKVLLSIFTYMYLVLLNDML